MKIKRVIAAFIAAAMFCGSAAVTAGAEELRSFTPGAFNGAGGPPGPDTFYEGAGYNTDAYYHGGEEIASFVSVATLDNSSVSKENELIIQAKVNGKEVTEFTPCYEANAGGREIEKMFIPSSITLISVDIVGWYPSTVAFSMFPDLKDIYYEGTEEQWYEIQQSYNLPTPLGSPVVTRQWDGKFSKDSNFAYEGIDNITLHVNCKDINDNGTIVGSTEPKTTKPAKVSGIKKSRSKTYIKLSWNESKNAESYIIMYSTDKKVWKTKTVKASSVRLTKLKAGTKYYIKVAAKNSVGTSAYSKVFSVTTKK